MINQQQEQTNFLLAFGMEEIVALKKSQMPFIGLY